MSADIGRFVSTLRKEGLGAARRLFIQYEDAVVKAMDEEDINDIIIQNKLDTNKIADGYHTFKELYDHRIALFVALAKKSIPRAWKSKKHSDGTMWDGWFIAGINFEKGEQITYHLPIEHWDDLPTSHVLELEEAPEFDGHTSVDVLERLKEL